MKKICILVALVFVVSVLYAGTPNIDGNFDGTGTWGSAVATADGNAGWASANAKNLYVTYDNNYVYFGAEVTASTWFQWTFILNTKSGGGSTEVWSRSIDYAHTNLPDYLVVGHFNGYSELYYWSGSSWTRDPDSAYPSENYGENITGDIQDGFIEVRVLKSYIGNAATGDIQFYITGDNNAHGTFDACPDDENAIDWDHSLNHTKLDNYQQNVTLPVSLSAFTAQYLNSTPTLYWETQSETDNMGWFIYRNQVENFTSATKVSGMIEGHGTTTQIQSYIYEDVIANPQVGDVYYYWLESVDYSGTIHHFDKVAMITIPETNDPNQNITPPPVYDLLSSPNPFNQYTNISFMLTQSAMVDVEIYDVKGALVKSFGTQHVTAKDEVLLKWYGNDENGKSLPNGIYLYSVKVDGQEYSTKRVILMK